MRQRKVRMRQSHSELTAFSLLALSLLAILTVSLPSSIASGQQQETDLSNPPSTGKARTRGTDVRMVERSPRLIYAEDADGNRVPLINVPLERIQQLLDGNPGNNPRLQPPSYQVDRFEIKGRADSDRALLDVSVEITTLRPEDDKQERWISVPLRMHESSLLDSPDYQGDGQVFLTHDATDGYQAWIRHRSSGKHKISLQFATNLSRAALATQIRFFPPTANISNIVLNVPGERISADIENGEELTISPSAESRSMISATDLRNQVIIVWRDGIEVPSPKMAYLDARGDIQVSIDGPGAIRSTVSLDVRSYTNDMEAFAIRLPPFTTIVSEGGQGYQISELNRPAPNADDTRRTVQVTLDNPSPEIQLQFTTQTTGEAASNDEKMGLTNVANFEVMGALRQSGRVSLNSSEDWLVYWYLGPSVRRVQAAEETDATQERKQLANFEYFRQPCRLDVETKPQSTRINVAPTYRIKVGEDRVSLEVVLRYKIRGARVSFLDFGLNGWNLDDVGPSTTVANDHFQDDAQSNIKLRLTQPRTGEFELVLNLHRPVTESVGTLRFPLPWPNYDTITPGILIITGDASVVLNYRLDEMVGLTQESVPAEFITTQTLNPIQPATAFRFRNDRSPSDVVVDYEIRDQEISVRTDTVVEVSAENVEVAQRFTYNVLYEPATRLTLSMPRDLYDLAMNPRYRNRIDLRLDGEQFTPDKFLNTTTDSEKNEDKVSLAISLDPPRLGPIDLQLSFPWPLSSRPNQGYTDVPLANPSDGQVLGNTASLNPMGPMQVELATNTIWDQVEQSLSNNSLAGISLSSSQKTESIPIRATKRQEDIGEETTPGATIVQRAWMQSWLANNSRLDRAVYQIASGSDRVYLDLPESSEVQSLIVDGLETPPLLSEQGLEIRVARRTGGEHTIELALRYDSRPSVGAMNFLIPRFRDALPARRWFWQLLLPKNEHLLLADSQLTSANRWERRGWFWHRTSNMTQPSLESWTGGSTQPELPDSLNQYLFSSFDRVEQISVRTSNRRTLVYTSCAIIAFFGLALIYFPRLRHPAILLILALLLLSGSWLIPSASLLLAQASLLGAFLIVISLLVATITRRFSSHRPSQANNEGSSDSRSKVQITWRETGSNSSTQAAPMDSMPAITPDSKA